MQVMPVVDIARPKESKWEHIAHQKPYYAPPTAKLPDTHYLNPRKPSSTVSGGGSTVTPLTPQNLSLVPKIQLTPHRLLGGAGPSKRPPKSAVVPSPSRFTTSTSPVKAKKVRSCPASIAESLSPSCSASQAAFPQSRVASRQPSLRPPVALNEEWQLCIDCHRHIPIRRGVLGHGGWKHASSWECSKGLR